jgi:hypothetical protein
MVRLYLAVCFGLLLLPLQRHHLGLGEQVDVSLRPLGASSIRPLLRPAATHEDPNASQE